MLTTQSLLRTMRATGTIIEYREHHKELSLTEAYSKSSSTFEPASELDTSKLELSLDGSHLECE